LKRKMFLQLNHQHFDVYKATRAFVKECYFATKEFPSEEKFILVQQIRRAALSVHLNLAEGVSKKIRNREKRFFEVSRCSIIEMMLL